MLKLGGYINILIAIGHVVSLLWAEQVFELTGVADEMAYLMQIHSTLPYLLTILVVVAFLIFGLYGLSADDKFRKLPFLKPAIFTIAGIYLLRGIAGFYSHNCRQFKIILLLDTCYSLIAVFSWTIYLIGRELKNGEQNRLRSN